MSHRTAFSAQALAVLAALAARPSAWRHGYDLARRGWFGPVRGSITARLVRVAGCVAICGLGVAVVRMDSHLGLGPHGPGPFSLPREIAALVLLGAVLAALAVGKARWPDDPGLWDFLSGAAGVLMFAVVPLQALAIVYVAGILAATSRRSPVTSVSLAIGTITGLAAGLAVGLAVSADSSRSLYRPAGPWRSRHDVPARRPRGRGGGLAAVRSRGPAGAASGADPSGTARGLGCWSCLRPAGHELLRRGRVR